MKTLFLSNLATDMSDPFFRQASYRGLLLPMARNLLGLRDNDVRIMANPVIAKSIRGEVERAGIDQRRLIEVNLSQLSSSGWNDFMIRSYTQQIPALVFNTLQEIVSASLGPWEPDVILCWEAPTTFFRQLFPDALVVDLMPGLFMRPPFAPMISLDPRGLYRDCWYRGMEPGEFSASDKMLSDLKEIQNTYLEHFDNLDVPSKLKAATGIDLSPETRLVPLQVGQYFGWSRNTHYADQYQFLESVLDNTPPEIPVFPTQYIAKHISDRVITDNNISILKSRYPNLVYDPIVENLDNISQYILPYSNSIVTISSTLGLQAAFFDKFLISPSTSHLSYIADSTHMDLGLKGHSKPRDEFMANYLFRSNAFRERLVNDGRYLRRILDAMIERKHERAQESLPTVDEIDNRFSSIIGASNFEASTKHFNAAFRVSETNAKEQRIDSTKGIDDENIDLVSFDVFDTLLCRTVLEPGHIFDLMGQVLRKDCEEISEEILNNFANARQGIERKLRYRFDQVSGEGAEFTVREVYTEMCRTYNLPHNFIDKFIEIEKQVELSCLTPRKEAVSLFQRSIQSGKKTIIISDFIHTSDFVAEALHKNGIDGWDYIFVSSNIGYKKHDGSLFEYIKKELAVDSDRWLHIGDNAHGDIAMAQAKGIHTQMVPALPRIIKDHLAKREANMQAVREDIVIGSILSGYAAEYLDLNRRPSVPEINQGDLIEQEKGFGFLALGPLMYFYTRHLLQRAQGLGVKQVIFFARDCWLPYNMARDLTTDQSAPKILYWPVSRAATSGLDIYRPEDVMKVRIDDFKKRGKLTDLMEKRFHLLMHEIDEESVGEWTARPLHEISVGNLPEYAIYDIAFQSAQKSSATYLGRLNERRGIFQKGAVQWGTDFSLPTMTVDIGYKGSIHSKIAHFFSTPPIPQMLVSYPNRAGEDPIDNLDAYYLARHLPQMKHADPISKYNLIFETIINEAVPSTAGYYENSENQVVRIPEGTLDHVHLETINQIHAGALHFVQWWTEHCQLIEQHIKVSQRNLSMLFEMVLSSPTGYEARMLGNLVFDNDFGGHKVRRIIEGSPSRKTIDRSLWKEGALALSRESSTYIQNYTGSGFIQKRLLGIIAEPVVTYVVCRFASEKLCRKFRRDPVAFFADSRSRYLRGLGRLLYFP